MRKYVLLLLLLPALLLAAACTPDSAGESLPADTSSDAVSAPEKPCQTAQVYIDCPTDITKDAYVPVSYTHLDVYKRQVLYCNRGEKETAAAKTRTGRRT